MSKSESGESIFLKNKPWGLGNGLDISNSLETNYYYILSSSCLNEPLWRASGGYMKSDSFQMIQEGI